MRLGGLTAGVNSFSAPPSPLVLGEMGGTGIPKHDNEEWKQTAVYYWGLKRSDQDEEMSELDFGLPKYDFHPQFNGVDRMAENCSHGIPPARRVANEDMDIGMRFLGCQYEINFSMVHMEAAMIWLWANVSE